MGGGLSCIATPLSPAPAGFRCGVEGIATSLSPGLIISLNQTNTYLECANLCGTQVGKCKTFSYSNSTKACNLYRKNLANVGYKKQVGSGVKFWNRACFGQCTCPSNSLWTGYDCRCQPPLSYADTYGNVCRCPVINQYLNANNTCVCPQNQIPQSIPNQDGTPIGPNAGDYNVQVCGCPPAAPKGRDGSCKCPGDTKLNIYSQQCECPSNTELVPGTTQCRCLFEGGTTAPDGSCACAAPKVPSSDYTKCVCPQGSALDPVDDVCIQCDAQPDARGVCRCQAAGGATQPDGSCQCPFTGQSLQGDQCSCPGDQIVKGDACACPATGQTLNENNLCACPGEQGVLDGACTCPINEGDAGDGTCEECAPEHNVVDNKCSCADGATEQEDQSCKCDEEGWEITQDGLGQYICAPPP